MSMALVVGIVSSIANSALGTEPHHRVFQNYPMEKELQTRVQDARARETAQFELALQDFGDAILVRHNPPKGPEWPGKKIPGIPITVVSEPKLSHVKTPAQWEYRFQKADEALPNSPWERFWRSQVEILTIDDSSPVLSQVLIDIVLNGWHDWNLWDHEKLIAIRSKYPELHRVYAMRELGRLKVNEATRVLLEVFTDPSTPDYRISS